MLAATSVTLLFVSSREGSQVFRRTAVGPSDAVTSWYMKPAMFMLGTTWTLMRYMKRRMRRREDQTIALEMMRKFVAVYTEKTGSKNNKAIRERVIKGLVENKAKYGTPLCPCRSYESPEEEAKRAYWNCPCEPMRKERKCHCLLFLPPEHPLADIEDFGKKIPDHGSIP